MKPDRVVRGWVGVGRHLPRHRSDGRHARDPLV